MGRESLMLNKREPFDLPISQFNEITVRKGRLALTWEYIGEGKNGDFNPAFGADDYPHLRATVSCDGEDVEKGSYCTLASVTTPKDRLIGSALALLYLADRFNTGEVFDTKLMEFWTWVEYDDLEKTGEPISGPGGIGRTDLPYGQGGGD
jgi:hypothetical protein